MDLIYLVIALMIGIAYATINNDQQNNISNTSMNMAEIIKDNLVEIYYSDISDKRERIVKLLLQLHRIEETDEFFNDHDYIREYIFNPT